jgi:GntR family transcriptional regulator
MTRSDLAASSGATDNMARWRELTRDFGIGSSGMPLHVRISQLMVDLIESGELAVGERLPAERELAELLGVSLAPVRQAILDAVNKGLLVRGPGLEEKVSILHSLTESMQAQHVEVDTRVLRQESVPMPAELAKALGTRERKALLIERVAIVGREPVALLQAYLSPRAYPGLMDASFANHSLYETLRDKYATVVTSASSVIELSRSTSAEAEKLGIAVGEPLLRVEGTACDELGNPVEYFRVLYRGDRVRFHLESHRQSDRVVRLLADDQVSGADAGQALEIAKGRTA